MASVRSAALLGAGGALLAAAVAGGRAARRRLPGLLRPVSSHANTTKEWMETPPAQKVVFVLQPPVQPFAQQHVRSKAPPCCLKQQSIAPLLPAGEGGAVPAEGGC